MTTARAKRSDRRQSNRRCVLPIGKAQRGKLLTKSRIIARKAVSTGAAGSHLSKHSAMAKIIVVGLGAMGSAAAQHLTERGHQVIAFDRFTPPHSKGSSHGQTRMIRQAYWEDSRYV